MKKILIFLIIFNYNLYAFDIGIIAGLTSGIISYIGDNHNKQKVATKKTNINNLIIGKKCTMKKYNYKTKKMETYNCNNYKNGRISK